MSTFNGFLFETLPFWMSLIFFFTWQINGGPPCPPPDPLVPSKFTSNTNLRSQTNKYKRREKMLRDFTTKCSIINTKYQ